ncbi:MAG: uracil-DNA glycosylase [Chloroflexi bacterium]|nr:uracil-DNA glycosylase [Chloroflexota bacterium]
MEDAVTDSPDSLAALHDEIVACRACPRLVEWREEVAREKRAAYRDWDYWGRPVPGFGDPGARLVIVGLAPAAHGANRTGRVFTGDRSGDWLFGAMHRAGFANQPTAEHRDDGLALLDAYVLAAVRCPPPQNRPTTEERDNCRPFLERELALLPNTRVLLVLGGWALGVLASVEGIRPRPKFGHGAEFELPDGRVVLCSYHPSQQNTFTGRLTQPMFDAVFARARELIEGAPIASA